MKKKLKKVTTVCGVCIGGTVAFCLVLALTGKKYDEEFDGETGWEEYDKLYKEEA